MYVHIMNINTNQDFVSEQPYTSESERERMFELAAQCDMRATDNTFLEEVPITWFSILIY